MKAEVGNAAQRALDPEMLVEVVVPVAFVDGRMPRDWRYPLYAALAWVLPSLKSSPFQLGEIVDGGLLWFRCPVSMLDEVASAEGGQLRIGGAILVLSEPFMRPLKPRPALCSDVVVLRSTSHNSGGPGRYRNGRTDATFGLALARQLVELGISLDKAQVGRHAVEIRVGKRGRVRGLPVSFVDLTDEESLTLQHEGLGGKRRMGAGVLQ